VQDVACDIPGKDGAARTDEGDRGHGIAFAVNV
jgi:hypothetical protein